ncbi:formate/nitrite transporter family protein [Demequina sp. B12]|uniref:formate/nitrite transporter family protein n=1 Tax=Demequina sp. B12 TaxID=2992757 RepID=UPI00237C29E6|nr:formate/nitrite transporter family protein [Demequina sp. B12]MDE0573570.1 formate/nitrite transporter family protein [Demequina sp. B12]
MLSITDAVENQARDAADKVHQARNHPWRFLISGMLAGMWVGAGVYVMFSAAGSFFMQGSAATRLVSGAVFAIALTFVVFAGGQLATSAMMALPMGAMRRVVSWWQATWTLGAILLGNLLGSLGLAWVLKMAGIFTHADTQGMLDGALTLKMSFTPTEMFFRAVMCNILVCGAIWAASRVKSEAAKAIIIFWGVFGFIASMFEHVVANMTVFGLGLVGASTVTVSWSAFGTMLVWVGLGNLVGGLVVLGIAYTVVGGPYGRTSHVPGVYASTESIAAKP